MKIRNSKKKGLFYTKNESWWFIGFSMLLSSSIIIEPQLICSSLLNGQLSDMWLYWSGMIGTAFSISFFAHLWKHVPVKTENEFLFFRYSGRGALILHLFRSLYLGLLIVPFIISFSVLAFSKLICYLLVIELHWAIIGVTVFIGFLTFFNDLKARLRIDFVLFVVFMVLFLVIFFGLLYTTGGLSHLVTTLHTSKTTYSILPSMGTKTFNAFVVFVMVQWWSAALLDYPDMNGQKLMASESSAALVKSVFLPSLFLILFRVLLFTLPFMAVCYGYATASVDGELAFASLFMKALPSWMLVVVVLFFIIPLVSFVQNTQNWGGSLLVANFYKYTFKKDLSEKQENRLGLWAMLYILLISGIIALYADSLVGITKYLFAITAGVGPVFMLRWYWWRINAWSQLTAMLAALVYPPILDWLQIHSELVHHFIMQLELHLNLEYYPVKILVLTVVVCLTWLIVTFITPPTERHVLQTFANTIKPGGFWKGFERSGSVFSKLRLAAWLLQTVNGFLLYFIFWNFLLGHYLRTMGLLLLFVVCFFVSYRLIQRANSKYDTGI